MIWEESYKKAWIEEKARELGKVDSKLLEKVIFSLTLVEQLKLNGLTFIFKGGTSLTLVLKQPRRFSIDIDIVLPVKQENLNSIFDKIVDESIFTRWISDNERKGKTNAPVEHYKFFYSSAIDSHFGEEPILLDILYDTHNYSNLLAIPIKHPWLRTKNPTEAVVIPSLEDLLGDKLTAFAPNTTGILYAKNKPVEIIKQLYDIGSLFDEVQDLAKVNITFQAIAKAEISYRKLDITSTEILADIFNTAIILSERDAMNAHFTILQTGISNIKNFIYFEKFKLESAIVCASKAAYLSTLILTEAKGMPQRFSNSGELKDWLIENPDFNKLNKVKKSQPEAFFYWYKAIELMSK
jgi:predicted nucleotidyltransferase component of viral defense system